MLVTNSIWVKLEFFALVILKRKNSSAKNADLEQKLIVQILHLQNVALGNGILFPKIVLECFEIAK